MFGSKVLLHQSVSWPVFFPFLEVHLHNRTSPTGGVAAAILFFNLHLNPHQGRTVKEHAQDFDFVGLFLVVTGVVLLLLGFNESETSCTFISFFKLWNISDLSIALQGPLQRQSPCSRLAAYCLLLVVCMRCTRRGHPLFHHDCSR